MTWWLPLTALVLSQPTVLPVPTTSPSTRISTVAAPVAEARKLWKPWTGALGRVSATVGPATSTPPSMPPPVPPPVPPAAVHLLSLNRFASVASSALLAAEKLGV